MELCEMCLQIDVWKWTVQETGEQDGRPEPHHASYTDLSQSGSRGCRLCVLLKDTLLDSMHEYAVGGHTGCEWQPATLETYLLDQKNFSEESFFVIPKYFQPDDGYGLQTDGPLLRGFRFQKGSIENTCLPLGPLLLFKTSDESAIARIPGRLNALSRDLSVAKRWLHDCVSEHAECVQREDAPLPTRLVDCESRWSDQNARLVESSLASGPYIALSHCWGSVQPLRTTKQNYEIHRRDMQFAHLPASFQDAILVARYLGVSYVWIDSLCIIQDSTKDWEQECSKMAKVYANALLTIAASDAPDCTTGFLRDYDRYKPIKSTFRYWNPEQHLAEELTVEYTPREIEEIIGNNSPLSSRGWALQERLLSQRTISFRDNQLHWECNKYSRSDHIHHTYVMNRMLYNIVEKRNIHLVDDVEMISDYWCDLIDTYTKCSLTNAMDKLPAISGLARAFSRILRDTYLAGLWRKDIHVGLTWQVLERQDKASDCDEEGVSKLGYRAPSWSWASTDSAVGFLSDNRKHDKDLAIIAGHTVPESIETFGRVASGSLRVNGRLKRATVRRASPHYLVLESTGLAKEHSPIARVSIDSPRERRRLMGNSLETEDVMALLISSDPSGRNRWIALALVQALDPERTFQRVGLIVYHSEFNAGYDWFNECPRQVLDII